MAPATAAGLLLMLLALVFTVVSAMPPQHPQMADDVQSEGSQQPASDDAVRSEGSQQPASDDAVQSEGRQQPASDDAVQSEGSQQPASAAPPPVCKDDEFSCGEYRRNHTYCLPKNHRCDRMRDCADGSDEKDCNFAEKKDVAWFSEDTIVATNEVGNGALYEEEQLSRHFMKQHGIRSRRNAGRTPRRFGFSFGTAGATNEAKKREVASVKTTTTTTKRPFLFWKQRTSTTKRPTTKPTASTTKRAFRRWKPLTTTAKQAAVPTTKRTVFSWNRTPATTKRPMSTTERPIPRWKQSATTKRLTTTTERSVPKKLQRTTTKRPTTTTKRPKTTRRTTTRRPKTTRRTFTNRPAITKRTTTKRPTTKRAITKRPATTRLTTTKRPTTKRAITKRPTRRTTTKRPTTKRAITKRPTRRTTTKRPTTKRAITKRPTRRTTTKRPTTKRAITKRPTRGTTTKRPTTKTTIKRPLALLSPRSATRTQASRRPAFHFGSRASSSSARVTSKSRPRPSTGAIPAEADPLTSLLMQIASLGPRRTVGSPSVLLAIAALATPPVADQPALRLDPKQKGFHLSLNHPPQGKCAPCMPTFLVDLEKCHPCVVIR